MCKTFRPGDPGAPEDKPSPNPDCGGVDVRLRLRFTVVKKPLFLRLFSCIELAGELPAGLELVLGESSASPSCSEWFELCRFHFKRSILTSFSSGFPELFPGRKIPRYEPVQRSEELCRAVEKVLGLTGISDERGLAQRIYVRARSPLGAPPGPNV